MSWKLRRCDAARFRQPHFSCYYRRIRRYRAGFARPSLHRRKAARAVSRPCRRRHRFGYQHGARRYVYIIKEAAFSLRHLHHVAGSWSSHRGGMSSIAPITVGLARSFIALIMLMPALIISAFALACGFRDAGTVYFYCYGVGVAMREAPSSPGARYWRWHVITCLHECRRPGERLSNATSISAAVAAVALHESFWGIAAAGSSASRLSLQLIAAVILATPRVSGIGSEASLTQTPSYSHALIYSRNCGISQRRHRPPSTSRRQCRQHAHGSPSPHRGNKRMSMRLGCHYRCRLARRRGSARNNALMPP